MLPIGVLAMARREQDMQCHHGAGTGVVRQAGALVSAAINGAGGKLNAGGKRNGRELSPMLNRHQRLRRWRRRCCRQYRRGGHCRCRRPSTGLLRRASQEPLDLDETIQICSSYQPHFAQVDIVSGH
jgi:hypothetical protein